MLGWQGPLEGEAKLEDTVRGGVVRVITGLKATTSVPEATGSSRLNSSPARKRIKTRNFSGLKYPCIQRGHTWLSPAYSCVCAFLIWSNFPKLYVKCGTVDIKVFTGIIVEERCDLSSQRLSLLQWGLTEKVLRSPKKPFPTLNKTWSSWPHPLTSTPKSPH